MTNPKTKGSKNERGVAKLFTNWTGYEFARTPQSGGLHWKKQNTVGDIVCIDEEHSKRFYFSIECKFHAEIEFSYLLDETVSKKNNKLIEFWKQAYKDAETVNKTPLLFVRRNMMKANTHFVIMPIKFYTDLKREISLNLDFGILIYRSQDFSFVIVNSQDFFTWDYSVCRKIGFRIKRKNLYGKNKS